MSPREKILAAAAVVRLGAKELEARLGVNRSTFYRWYKAGRFPEPHFIGDRRMWFLSEVEAWERETVAKSPKARRGAVENLSNQTAPKGASTAA